MSLPLPSIQLPQALIQPLSRPIVPITRSSLFSLFSKLTVGQLEIRTPDGRAHKFGDPTLVRSKEKNNRNDQAASPDARFPPSKAQAAQTAPVPSNRNAPHAILIVKSDNFYLRMFFGADLGFAESFMIGEVDTPDLGACFDVSFARFWPLLPSVPFRS